MIIPSTTSILNLPDEIHAHMFQLLHIDKLSIMQQVNKKYRMLKSLIILIKSYNIIIISPIIKNLSKNMLDYEKHNLKNIRCRLTICGLSRYTKSIDTTSLKKFNHSIKWLENFKHDAKFIELLYPKTGFLKPKWLKDELFYVNKWIYEFNDFWKEQT